MFLYFSFKNNENTMCFCTLYACDVAVQNEKCKNIMCFYTFRLEYKFWILLFKTKNIKTHCVLAIIFENVHRVLAKYKNLLKSIKTHCKSIKPYQKSIKRFGKV